MSNPFNNYKKIVMKQSLHITAKYTTSLAETLLFILVTLYPLSIPFQCHLFIYLLILYIDFHTIESNMNHRYQNMKNKNLGEINLTPECAFKGVFHNFRSSSYSPGVSQQTCSVYRRNRQIYTKI